MKNILKENINFEMMLFDLIDQLGKKTDEFTQVEIELSREVEKFGREWWHRWGVDEPSCDIVHDRIAIPFGIPTDKDGLGYSEKGHWNCLTEWDSSNGKLLKFSKKLVK